MIERIFTIRDFRHHSNLRVIIAGVNKADTVVQADNKPYMAIETHHPQSISF
jgi:tRNA A37 threonylcarbamoyladenosine synthetase subunit TsaC/SUA5/YrdC